MTDRHEGGACNLCGGTRLDHLFDEQPAPGFRFSVRKCPSCGLIATIPAPSQEFLSELYSEQSYQLKTVSGSYCLDEHVSAADHERMLEAVGRVTGGRRLLDVGCGRGLFVKAALEKGWDAYGVEPSPYAGRIACDELSHRVCNGFLEDSGFEDSSFDAVTLWYVLEHVRDPKGTIEFCSRLLKPRGILFIAVPNARYILFRRWLKKALTGVPGSVHAHEHLYQFSPGTLRKYIERAGLYLVFEDIASPYMVSGPAVNVVKGMAGLAAACLMRATGINVGGILMLCRKD